MHQDCGYVTSVSGRDVVENLLLGDVLRQEVFFIAALVHG